MKKPSVTRLMLFLFSVALSSSPANSLVQATPAGTIPVSMVVSVEAKHGGEVPAINREDVRALHGNTRLRVTDWVALQGDQAELELFVLLDEASDPNIGMQFDDLRQFMSGQPATTAIAVGYMRYGTVDIVQKLTKDQAQAGKSLRLPLGSGVSASPYLSMSDLMKHWPESAARREIFLIRVELTGCTVARMIRIWRRQSSKRNEPGSRSMRSTPRRWDISVTVFGGSAGAKTISHNSRMKPGVNLISRVFRRQLLSSLSWTSSRIASSINTKSHSSLFLRIKRAISVSDSRRKFRMRNSSPPIGSMFQRQNSLRTVVTTVRCEVEPLRPAR